MHFRKLLELWKIKAGMRHDSTLNFRSEETVSQTGKANGVRGHACLPILGFFPLHHLLSPDPDFAQPEALWSFLLIILIGSGNGLSYFVRLSTLLWFENRNCSGISEAKLPKN